MSERPDAGEIPDAEPFVEVTSCAAFTVTVLFLNSVAAKQNSGERVPWGGSAVPRAVCAETVWREGIYCSRWWWDGSDMRLLYPLCRLGPSVNWRVCTRHPVGTLRGAGLARRSPGVS